MMTPGNYGVLVWLIQCLQNWSNLIWQLSGQTREVNWLPTNTAAYLEGWSASADTSETLLLTVKGLSVFSSDRQHWWGRGGILCQKQTWMWSIAEISRTLERKGFSRPDGSRNQFRGSVMVDFKAIVPEVWVLFFLLGFLRGKDEFWNWAL